MGFSLLLVICFCAGWFSFKPNSSWRESYLKSSIAMGIAIVAITEGLSYARALTSSNVLIAWVMMTAAAVMVLFFKKRAGEMTVPVSPSLTFLEKRFCFGFGSIALVIGFIAWTCAPNTWDSMTYHLSRIMHWIQNHSVEHYPTSISRQLAYCPFSEFAILQTFLLSASDRFANLIQFVSMIGTWLALSLIARLLGADRPRQLLTVFLAAVIPMGVMQGSSTQTDYVAAFWISLFIYFVLKQADKVDGLNGIWAGLSLGLALLTKGYSYVYCFPFFCLYVYRCFSQRKWVLPWAVLLMALALNAGYFIRNIQTFGTFFGLTDATISGQWGPREILLRLAKNIVSQMTASFHKDEDLSGNLLHLVLIAWAVPLWLRSKNKTPLSRTYVTGLAWAAVLFVISVNWQPWITRFHLTFFLLVCPWLAMVFMELKPQVMGWGCVLLYIAVLPWLLTGSPRPLLGKNSYLKETRLEQYFYKKKDFLEIYEKAVKDLQLTKCSQIGLRSGGDHWEYPWWILLKDNGLRLEHLNGQRTTYPLGDFDPCAIITEGHEDHVIYKGSAYQKIGQSTMLSVLIKTPS